MKMGSMTRDAPTRSRPFAGSSAAWALSPPWSARRWHTARPRLRTAREPRAAVQQDVDGRKTNWTWTRALGKLQSNSVSAAARAKAGRATRVRYQRRGTMTQDRCGKPHAERGGSGARTDPAPTPTCNGDRRLRELRDVRLFALLPALHLPQARVGAIQQQQFVVRTAFENSALIHHQDLIGADNRRQPMRDHERGAATRDFLELGLDRALGSGVERRGRLIEHQDRRLLQ